MPVTRTGTYTVATVPFWRRALAVSASPANLGIFAGIFVLRLVFRLVALAMPAIGKPGIFVISLGVYGLAFAGLLMAGSRRNPPPVLDFDRHEIRIGNDVVPFIAITEATTTQDAEGTGLEQQLVVAAPHHRKVAFVLRAQRLPVLNATDREVVADMLALTDIRLPASKPDPYDPTGKFAWMDHPNSRTKEQAIALLLGDPEEKP